jgi:hypothetical protein
MVTAHTKRGKKSSTTKRASKGSSSKRRVVSTRQRKVPSPQYAVSSNPLVRVAARINQRAEEKGGRMFIIAGISIVLLAVLLLLVFKGPLAGKAIEVTMLTTCSPNQICLELSDVVFTRATVNPNEEFTLAVVSGTTDDITSTQFTLNYDSSLFTYQTFTPPTGWDFVNVDDSTPGQLTFTAMANPASPLTTAVGILNLVEFDFTAQSPVNLPEAGVFSISSDVEVMNADTLPINVITGYVDATISIVEEDAGNTPPVVSDIPNAVVTVGDTYSYNVVATDDDVDDTLTYSLTGVNSISGESFDVVENIDVNTGQILLSDIANGDVGVYTLTVTVSDSVDFTSVSWQLSIVTEEENTPPVWDTIPSQSVNYGNEAELYVDLNDFATDAEDDLSLTDLSFDLDGVSGFDSNSPTFTEPSIVTWTPTLQDYVNSLPTSPYQVTVRATDSEDLSADTTFTIVIDAPVIDPAHSPVIGTITPTGVPPHMSGDQAFHRYLYTTTQSIGPITLTADDANSDDETELTFSSSELPTGLELNTLIPGEATLSGTPLTVGEYLIAIEVHDGLDPDVDTVYNSVEFIILEVSTPPVAEICDNGIDDDGDSFIDCGDTACVDDTYCDDAIDEICTGSVDEDLDTLIDCEDPDCTVDDACVSPCIDGDSDGYGSPASTSCTYSTLDCNDALATINPGATDICGNGIDEDCSGADLECSPPPPPPPPPPPSEPAQITLNAEDSTTDLSVTSTDTLTANRDYLFTATITPTSILPADHMVWIQVKGPSGDVESLFYQYKPTLSIGDSEQVQFSYAPASSGAHEFEVFVWSAFPSDGGSSLIDPMEATYSVS